MSPCGFLYWRRGVFCKGISKGAVRPRRKPMSSVEWHNLYIMIRGSFRSWGSVWSSWKAVSFSGAWYGCLIYMMSKSHFVIVSVSTIVRRHSMVLPGSLSLSKSGLKGCRRKVLEGLDSIAVALWMKIRNVLKEQYWLLELNWFVE